jgi:hypothetical protein
MTSKVVHSENPLEHWSDISDLQGKTVLDLGCGWIAQGFQSTPEYFLSRGASKVIGVDGTCTEIEELKKIYPEHIFLCQMINTAEDLWGLLSFYQPQVVKMDIEGYESVLKDMSAQDFQSVQEMAIEYHNPECKSILEQKFKEFSFEVTACNQFGYYCTDPNIMGIIHAKRIV